MPNPDRINIHELTIEEPEKQVDFKFDPERDITKNDWEMMKQLLEKYREDDESKSHESGQNVMYFPGQASYMKILDPAMDLGLNESVWQIMKKSLEKYRGKPNDRGVFLGHDLWDWALFARQAKEMKILNPEVDLHLDETAWQGLGQLLDERRNHNENKWSEFSSLAANMKILNPKADLNLDNTAWQGMRDALENMRTNNWWIFSWQAAEMKILDPSIDFNLDKTAWRELKQELKKCRGDWSTFTKQAMLLKILAAEKVEVTDKGLEITMGKSEKSLGSNTPPLPETKKY